MTAAPGMLAVIICATLTTATLSAPDCLAPPTALRYSWLDRFTVNVSWSRPAALPDGCDVVYLVQESRESGPRCTPLRWQLYTCLSDGSAGCSYTVQTAFRNYCEGNRSAPQTLTVDTSESYARLVTDFRCVGYTKAMRCSWTPVDPSQKLNISYRICGSSKEQRETLKLCEPQRAPAGGERAPDGGERAPAGGALRSSCSLSGVRVAEELCILVSSRTAWSTFHPTVEFPPPAMTVVENGSRFQLKFSLPDVGTGCIFTYEVSYKDCNEERREFFTAAIKAENEFLLPYNKMCRYEFRSRINGSSNCKNLNSSFGPVQTYGADEPPDGTLTALAVLLPLLLSVCVLLSCYCLRRHRSIICPIIPDPSAIFKEMMMNGSKDSKSSTGNLYVPVPEPTAPCKIDVPPENSPPPPPL